MDRLLATRLQRVPGAARVALVAFAHPQGRPHRGPHHDRLATAMADPGDREPDGYAGPFHHVQHHCAKVPRMGAGRCEAGRGRERRAG